MAKEASGFIGMIFFSPYKNITFLTSCPQETLNRAFHNVIISQWIFKIQKTNIRKLFIRRIAKVFGHKLEIIFGKKKKMQTPHQQKKLHFVHFSYFEICISFQGP